MNRRRVWESSAAFHLGALVAVWALSLALPSSAQAGCAARAHGATAPRSASLSAELLGTESAQPDSPAPPLKPGGCNGAFCSRPFQTPSPDFGAGVDLRSEAWARTIDSAHLLIDGIGRVSPPADDLRPILRRDFIFHPPR